MTSLRHSCIKLPSNWHAHIFKVILFVYKVYYELDDIVGYLEAKNTISKIHIVSSPY